MKLILIKIGLKNANKVVTTNVADKSATFSVTDTKLYVPVVTLTTQDNAKLLD